MTSLLVPHDPASAAPVRQALAADLAGAGVPEAAVDDALLVVTELVGNAVRHGAPLTAGGVRVTWWVAGGAVHVEVCDGGDGPVPGGRGPAPAGAESGRGLAIVELLCARWGTTAPSPSGAVGVWAELPLPGAAPARLSRGEPGRPLAGRRPWAVLTG